MVDLRQQGTLRVCAALVYKADVPTKKTGNCWRCEVKRLNNLLEKSPAFDAPLQEDGKLPEDSNKVEELTERCEQLVAQINEEDEEAERMREALEFYADPDTYFGMSIICDPPCGDFYRDFDEDHGNDFYDRAMPGKQARDALKEKDSG